MKHKKGFTLIELLVVIAIIGILASVVLSSLSSARTTAQYTKVASDLRSAELAFNLLRNQYGCWPQERSNAPGNWGDCISFSGTTNNPTVASLIASGELGLSQHLATPPSWPFFDAEWVYDNDNDIVTTPCADGFSIAGVMLVILNHATYEQFRNLNQIFDPHEDPATAEARGCGKIIWNSNNINGLGALGFVLSRDQR
ncbi:MAG: type II secretion system protein [Candidatus Paceibacteria bacterium]